MLPGAPLQPAEGDGDPWWLRDMVQRPVPAIDLSESQGPDPPSKTNINWSRTNRAKQPLNAALHIGGLV